MIPEAQLGAELVETPLQAGRDLHPLGRDAGGDAVRLLPGGVDPLLARRLARGPQLPDDAPGRLAEGPERDEVLHVHRQEEVADAQEVGIPLLVRVVQLGEKRPVLEGRREDLDHRRQAVALVAAHRLPAPAERQQRRLVPVHLLDQVCRVRREGAVLPHDPPRRNRLAGTRRDLDPAARGDGRRRIEGERELLVRRSAEGDRVRPQHRLRSERGRDRRMGVREAHAHHSFSRRHARVVSGDAVVAGVPHGHGADPVLAGLLDGDPHRVEADHHAHAVAPVDYRGGRGLADDVQRVTGSCSRTLIRLWYIFRWAMPCDLTPQRSAASRISATMRCVVRRDPHLDQRLDHEAGQCLHGHVDAGVGQACTTPRGDLGSVLEHLARVHHVHRIERLLDPPLHLDRHRAQRLLELGALESADAVLAGECPAHAPARRRISRRTICSTFSHSSGLRLSNRMLGCRLPSPAWPKITIGSPYLALIARSRWTTSGMALRGTVMSSPSLLGALRASEGEIGAARLPQRLSLALVLRHLHGPGAVLSADPAGGLDLASDRLLVGAVRLDEQDGLDVRRQPEVHRLLDAGDGRLVHQLQRGRDDPGREDGIDRARGIGQRRELGQRGLRVARPGDQAEQRLGDQAERPFRRR